jgi:hypothetical protein
MALELADYDALITLSGQPQVGVIGYEDDSTKPQTKTLDLRPPKQQFTSPTEFEQAPAYGDQFGQSDFSHGAGQKRYHSVGRDPKAYWYSDGVDISDPGRVKLLHDGTLTAEALPNIGRTVEIINDLPFVINNNGATRVRRGDGTWPGVWTAEDPGGGAGTCYDLTTSGDIGFAAQGNIYTRSAAGVWSTYTTKATTDVDRILWTKGRIIAADGRNIYEVTASGGTLGVTFLAMRTLPTSWRYEAIWEQGEFVYASAINTTTGRCEIHHFGPNSTLAALEWKGSMEMPRGQLIYSGMGYGTYGYLGGGVIEQGSAAKLHPIVYQTVPDARGFLSYIKLAEDNVFPGVHTLDHSVKAFEAYGEACLMGWNDYDSITDAGIRSGLAVHYPARDAFANHLSAVQTGTGAAVTGIRVYRGRILYVRAGVGLHYEDITNYAVGGSITTSWADFNNAGKKLWDTFDMAHSPLRAAEQIAVLSSFDPEGAASTTVLSDNTVGSTGATSTDTSNTQKGRVMQMTAYLTRGTDTTKTPILYSLSARANPFPTVAEFVLTRTFRILPKDQKDEVAQVVTCDPNAVKVQLEAMANNWVTVIEPGKTWTAYVVSAMDVTPMLPHARTADGTDISNEGFIVQLQMIAR